MHGRVGVRRATGARRRSQPLGHGGIAWIVAFAWGAGCEVTGEVGAAVGNDALDHDTAHGAEPFDGSGASTSTGGDAASSDDDTHRVPESSSGTSSSSDDGDTTIGETSVLVADLGSDRETEGDETFVDAIGDCCDVSDAPGCDDPAILACVCAIDEFCCSTAWDRSCVGIATYGPCAGGCVVDGPPPPDDCCLAVGGVGCLDGDVQDCVCAHDPYCCLYGWDDVCVDYVDQYGCGSCG